MKVSLIAALSCDGFIAQHQDQVSTSWTSKEDKQFFADISKKIGTIVMGKTTFATIGFPLSQRLNIVYSFGTIEDLAQEFNLSKDQISPKKLKVTSKPPQELIKELEQEGIEQMAICGGRSIYSLFMKAGVIDKLYLTVEPVIFGDGIKLFDDSYHQQLKLINSKKLNEQGTLLQEYECIKQ